ncbi:MAG: hypothetical protein B6I23_00005 [Rickettsiaceae bacterium 4572_127]|nr:MAG: hypothetical protein B6I23_00005 [Rickettsiaceae bacterium 4572_127]
MLKNYLAGKEMFIARKLMKEENYLGALKRFQLILKKFPVLCDLRRFLE